MAKQLNVTIVGSGIAGLACGLALRHHGHRVYEQSSLSQETGAAIWLPPNANGLVREYGFVPEDYGAVPHSAHRMYSSDGKLEMSQEFTGQEFDSPWQLIHRQKLHQALKDLAEGPSGPGSPVQILTSSRVTRVDPDSATTYLEDGSEIKADVVIGADGVSSNTRAAVQKRHGTDVHPVSSGKACFRFLIPREQLLSNPTTRPVFEADSVLMIWEAEDRKLVCYPCDNNTTLNFVAIHPAHLSDAVGDNDWNAQGNKDHMLSIFDDFCPEVRTIMKITDPEKLRVYMLLDMEPLTSWTAGSLALIGDAAHPYLPYQAQGGAQAIEDAMSIGVFLPADTQVSEIPIRLALYEKARKERAHHIQEASRLRSKSRSELEKIPYDWAAEQEYQFRHNELEHSRKVLREHLTV